jgi:Uncharacterized protein containing DHHC-type Zn finger
MEEARDDLINKWQQFNKELRDISTEFNHLYWIRVLFFAAVKYLLHFARLAKVASWLVSKRGHVLQFLPLCVICLVSLILLAYCFILHHEVIVKRWCGATALGDVCPATTSASTLPAGTLANRGGCGSSRVILCSVCYIGLMILYNFLRTTFSSPGIANLSKCQQSTTTTTTTTTTTSDTSSTFMDCNNQSGNGITTTTMASIDDDAKEPQWRSYHGQGGCCYLSLTPCIEKEIYLKKKYTIQLDEKRMSSSSLEQMQPTLMYIPNPSSSYCKKCKIIRPPRCHHCSKCNRCVLQMDHHCVWINNCIGYNNYRTFVLTLVYLVIGCWFGVALLFFPFYSTIQDQIQTDGFKFMYKHKSGFLDLPMPLDLLHELKNTGRLHTDLVLKIVFVILFFAGIPLSTFLYSHLCSIVQGLTTIEKMAKIEFQRYQLLRARQSPGVVLLEPDVVVVNPFRHEGVWNNLLQIIGPNPWLCLLPIPVQPPTPTMGMPWKSTSSMESAPCNNHQQVKQE